MFVGFAGASELLSQILHFYMNYFAQPGVKDHVLCIVNNSLINYIPWRVFWPTIADIEAMNKVSVRPASIFRGYFYVLLTFFGGLGGGEVPAGGTWVFGLHLRSS